MDSSKATSVFTKPFFGDQRFTAKQFILLCARGADQLKFMSDQPYQPGVEIPNAIPNDDRLDTVIAELEQELADKQSWTEARWAKEAALDYNTAFAEAASLNSDNATIRQRVQKMDQLIRPFFDRSNVEDQGDDYLTYSELSELRSFIFVQITGEMIARSEKIELPQKQTPAECQTRVLAELEFRLKFHQRERDKVLAANQDINRYLRGLKRFVSGSHRRKPAVVSDAAEDEASDSEISSQEVFISFGHN